MKMFGQIRNRILPILILISFYTRADDTILPNSKWKVKAEGFFTFSFISADNIKTKELNQFFIAHNSILNLERISATHSKNIEIRNDLSYTRFQDSIWIKNSDNLFVNFLYRQNDPGKTKASFNINFRSQISDTWIYRTTGNKLIREWQSGPLTPASLNISYGFNLKLNESSFVNIGLASIRFNSFNLDKRPFDSTDVKINRVGWKSQYGGTVLFSLDKNLLKIIKIENRSTFFASGLKKTQFGFDFQNRIWITIYKSLRFKTDTRFIYDYSFMPGIQRRIEFLVGIFVK